MTTMKTTRRLVVLTCALLWTCHFAKSSRNLQTSDAAVVNKRPGPSEIIGGFRKLTDSAKKLPPLGAGFWRVKGGNFYDSYWRQVRFSGVNWSGFETPDAVPHGLNQRSIASHLNQMKSLGLLVIRLPFAGDTLKSTTYPSNDVSGANPQLKGLNSLQIMDHIIAGCRARGMKVILDYHRIHLTVSNEDGTWFDDNTPEDVWVKNWMMLARRYRGNPTIIGADLFNEVHDNPKFPQGAPYWVYNAGENEKYNFRRASLRVINNVHRIEPNWIFFLEGMWNNYWWGGNCAELLKAPITWPATKIAFTAHEYGPYVAQLNWFFASNFPKNLPWIFWKNWGSIQQRGVKPVWVGEFGSFYPNKDSKLNNAESTSFETLVRYIGSIKASWTIFQWTPNSKDTGGILSDDWQTPNEKKLKLLRPIMHPGFKP